MRIISIKKQTSTLLNYNSYLMKENVSQLEVYDFKYKWCNENKIISNLVKNEINNLFIEPILDIGAGLGDIVYNALQDKEVICIDLNSISYNFPLSNNHQRLKVDFFDFIPNKKINTFFISHTLQFLDDRLDDLNDRIDSLSPQNIIIVINKNDDFLGDLVLWITNSFRKSNPEVEIPDFPKGYANSKNVDFSAVLRCETFEQLATQVSYLMLIEPDDIEKIDLINFLKSRLDKSEIIINQQIKIFSKDGK